jgi:hypothetical protein
LPKLPFTGKPEITMTDSVTSRIPGFYKKSLRERLARLVETGRLSPESIAFLRRAVACRPTWPTA